MFQTGIGDQRSSEGELSQVGQAIEMNQVFVGDPRSSENERLQFGHTFEMFQDGPAEIMPTR